MLYCIIPFCRLPTFRQGEAPCLERGVLAEASWRRHHIGRQSCPLGWKQATLVFSPTTKSSSHEDPTEVFGKDTHLRHECLQSGPASQKLAEICMTKAFVGLIFKCTYVLCYYGERHAIGRVFVHGTYALLFMCAYLPRPVGFGGVGDSSVDFDLLYGHVPSSSSWVDSDQLHVANSNVDFGLLYGHVPSSSSCVDPDQLHVRWRIQCCVRTLLSCKASDLDYVPATLKH